MRLRIFISLTRSDHELAVALERVLRELFGDQVDVHFSTKKDHGGIKAGDDWFNWVVTQVKECHLAFILISPASVGTEWILWEAGAVCGAASVGNVEWPRKVRPLLFQVEANQIPKPIWDSKAQAKRGDDLEDVMALLTDIAVSHPWEATYKDELVPRLPTMYTFVNRYLTRVRECLTTSVNREPSRQPDPSLLGGALNFFTAPELRAGLRDIRLELNRNSQLLASLEARVANLAAQLNASNDTSPRDAVDFLAELRAKLAERGCALRLVDDTAVELTRILSDGGSRIRSAIDFRVEEVLSGKDALDSPGGTVLLSVVGGAVTASYRRRSD